MKILHHTIEHGMIYVTTDNKDFQKFVYFADKFGSKAELEAEINKKIAIETERANTKNEKKAKLESELDAGY